MSSSLLGSGRFLIYHRLDIFQVSADSIIEGTKCHRKSNDENGTMLLHNSTIQLEDIFVSHEILG